MDSIFWLEIHQPHLLQRHHHLPLKTSFPRRCTLDNIIIVLLLTQVLRPFSSLFSSSLPNYLSNPHDSNLNISLAPTLLFNPTFSELVWVLITLHLNYCSNFIPESSLFYVFLDILASRMPEKSYWKQCSKISHRPHIAYKIIPTIEPGAAVLHEQCPSPVVLAFLPPGIFSSGTLPQYPTLKYLPYLCSCCLFPRSALNYL